jgi:hypothetical protein
MGAVLRPEMPRKQPLPRFSGPLAEPICEPTGSGILPLPEEERRRRIIKQWVQKLDLLADHYGIDQSDPEKWRLVCLYLALDFVPGMQVGLSRPPKPGRKRTWQAGLGDELRRAVQEYLATQPSRIEDAIEHLRKTDAKWGRYPPQTLAARLREAKRADRRRRNELAEALLADGNWSLARIAAEYHARMAMGGLFGLGQSVLPEASLPADENKEG